MTELKEKRVYFIAIAGTGMSALAGLLKQRSCEVAGSDLACFPPVSELLAKLQIDVHLGYDVEHLKAFKPDYVVIGNFVRKDNPQAQYVIEQGIPYGSFPSTLEKFFLKNTKNLVVVGTHGKSTTTTCLAYLLQSLGKKPGYLVGAIPFNFQKSFDVGDSEYFVLEGDEYDTAFFDKESKFLHYRPTWGIWTSLEFDHADIFPNMERLEAMFRKFLSKISPQGGLIYCRDWERVHELVQDFGGRKLSYGFHPESDWRIENFEESSDGLSFSVKSVHFRNPMTGRYNAQNFLAASLAVHMAAGYELSEIARHLPQFKGLKRRQELKFEKNSRRVIDDFAHHPTAVEEVILSTRKKYPDAPVVVFFEPRSNTSRRNIFQNEFLEAFAKADAVFLPEVFKKENLPEGESLDVFRIVSQLKERGVQAEGPLNQEELVARGQEFARKGPCSLLVLSNGSFEGIHRKLIFVLENL